MFMMPPRPTFLSAKGWSVGQTPPQRVTTPAAPNQATQITAPSQGAGGSDQAITHNELRNIIRQELQRGASRGGGAEETPTTGWAAFWTGMWDWLKGASGELITAGATVFITLYARELYAQSRLPNQQSARVALDLATPQTEVEKMTIDELDTEADNLIADFYADEPPSNLEIGERLQSVIELLIAKKLENLAAINESLEEAQADDDQEIIDRETARGEALADEIEGLEEDWDEVTDHLSDIIHNPKELSQFRKIKEPGD